MNKTISEKNEKLIENKITEKNLIENKIDEIKTKNRKNYFN